MKRMAYHLLAILILGMAASAVKAQILLTASATPIEEYAAVELQRYYYQLSGRLLSIDHEEVPDRKTEFVLTRLDHPLVKSWRRCEQPVEVLDERALAGARVADDAHELPGRDGEINIVDGDFFKRCPGTVGVPEMIHPDDWRHNFVSFIYR